MSSLNIAIEVLQELPMYMDKSNDDVLLLVDDKLDMTEPGVEDILEKYQRRFNELFQNRREATLLKKVNRWNDDDDESTSNDDDSTNDGSTIVDERPCLKKKKIATAPKQIEKKRVIKKRKLLDPSLLDKTGKKLIEKEDEYLKR